jgi:hypothetical protein
MAADERPDWARRMVEERAARDWSQTDAVRALMARLPEDQVVSEHDLLRQWKRWEAGDAQPVKYRSAIAQTFGTTTGAFFPERGRRDGRAEVLQVSGMDTVDIIARLRASDLHVDAHLQVCRQASVHHRTVAFSDARREAVGMLDNCFLSRGTWRRVSARLAGPGTFVRRVWPIGLNSAPRMVRMTAPVVTTRHAPVHSLWRRNGTVTTDVDQNVSVAPSIALGQGERGHGPKDLVRGVRSAGRTPLLRRDGDVIRVPAHSRSKTEPRRGVSNRGLLVLRRAVRAAQTHAIPVRTSSEGAGMT